MEEMTTAMTQTTVAGGSLMAGQAWFNTNCVPTIYWPDQPTYYQQPTTYYQQPIYYYYPFQQRQAFCADNVHVFACEHAETCKCGKATQHAPTCSTCGK